MGYEWKNSGSSLIGYDYSQNVGYRSIDQLTERHRLGEIYYQAFNQPPSDLAKFGNSIFVIAFLGTIVQGFLTITPGPIARIYNVATALEHRRKGVATRLIRSVLNCPIPGVKSDYFWLNVIDQPEHPTIDLVRLYGKANNGDGNFIPVARVNGGYHLDSSYQSIVMTFVRNVYQDPVAGITLVNFWREKNLTFTFATPYQSIPLITSRKTIPKIPVPDDQVWAIDSNFTISNQSRTLEPGPGLIRAVGSKFVINPQLLLLTLFWSNGTQILQYNKLYGLSVVGYYLLRSISHLILRQKILQIVKEHPILTPNFIFTSLTPELRIFYQTHIYNQVSSVPIFVSSESPGLMPLYN